MKKIIFFTLILLLITAALLPAQESISWGTNYGKKNIIFSGSAAIEKSNHTNFALYPEAEIILAKPVLGSIAFLDFGLAGKGRIALDLTESGISAGAGLMATMHMGFRGFDFAGAEYLENLDYYLKLGAGFDFLNPESTGLGFVSASGINYFLDEQFSLGLGYTGWRDYSGISISASIRLGNKPVVKGMDTSDLQDDFQELGNQIYLLQFYAIYMVGFYSGGYFFTDNDYNTGEGTIIRVTDSSGSDALNIERALLETTERGTNWWLLKFHNDTDEVIYEFEVDKDYRILRVVTRDEEGEIIDITIDDELDARYSGEETAIVTETELEEWYMGGAELTVEAGTFETIEFSSVSIEAESFYTWWLADEGVPGRLVKSRIENGEDWSESELVKIISGANSILR